MPYRECPDCRHVETAEDRTDFDGACPKCARVIPGTTARAFIEPKSFVTCSDKPNGQDPGLIRLRPAPAQEARLLSAADEASFLVNPANVPRTSWAWQDAKQGRMFVVNKGRGSGFLRCSCGYTKLLKNQHDEQQERQRKHRTPFNSPCAQPFWYPHEDLGHEFRTDVLQVRLDHSLPVPKDLPLDELDDWMDRFTRTLAEAVRRSGADLLGIEPREIAVTVRTRLFGYPEVILYDTVAGGAGYCRMWWIGIRCVTCSRPRVMRWTAALDALTPAGYVYRIMTTSESGKNSTVSRCYVGSSSCSAQNNRLIHMLVSTPHR